MPSTHFDSNNTPQWSYLQLNILPWCSPCNSNTLQKSPDSTHDMFYARNDEEWITFGRYCFDTAVRKSSSDPLWPLDLQHSIIQHSIIDLQHSIRAIYWNIVLLLNVILQCSAELCLAYFLICICIYLYVYLHLYLYTYTDICICINVIPVHFSATHCVWGAAAFLTSPFLSDFLPTSPPPVYPCV